MLTEDQRDCLQETVNVAMGKAGDVLARLLDVFVTLSVPRIIAIERDEFGRAHNKFFDAKTPVSVVRQGFYSSRHSQGLRGECILVFNETSYRELAELMSYDHNDLDESAETELLVDVTNVLCGACLGGFAEQVGDTLSYSRPSLAGRQVPVESIFASIATSNDRILLISISFKIENRTFDCTMLLMMPAIAVTQLVEVLDRLLEAV